MGRKPLGDRPMTPAERQRRQRERQSFVVFVRDGLHTRCFGIYRSFTSADSDARAWNGTVELIEPRTTDEPWNATFHAVS